MHDLLLASPVYPISSPILLHWHRCIAPRVSDAGVYRYCNLYPIALDMVANGSIDLKPLLSGQFPLSQANEAFQSFSTGEPIKLIIRSQQL